MGRLGTRGAGALAAITVLVAGCSTEVDQRSPGHRIDSTRPLTSAQLRGALLTPADLGTDFHKGDHADGPNGTGCLTHLQVADSLPRRAELTLYAGHQFGLPTVLEGIGTFDTEQAAARAMNRYRTIIASCPHDDDHDIKGGRDVMDFSFGADIPLLPVDDQIVMTGSGTVGSPPYRLATNMSYVIARIGRHVVLTGFGDARPQAQARTAVGRVAISAVTRFRALLAGTAQPELAPIGLRPTEVQDVVLVD